MLEKLANFLFSTNSRSLRRKQMRTLWVAIVLGLVLAVIVGVGLYVMNQQGRI